MLKQQLIDIIRTKALFYGDFELASGQKSNYYIDLSKVVLDSKGLKLISWSIIDNIDTFAVDTIGGPAYGGIPLVSGVLTLVQYPLKGFFFRKELKEHRKKELVEGYLEKGSNVILVEDVVTTGKSLIKVIEAVEAKGCNIVQLISVVDRSQGKSLFDIPFKSILKIEEIL